MYQHYTVEDGLPSSEVYSAFQDSKGYIWFATDAGVSRFNGYEFQNFDVSNGLTDNTVFLIDEDNKGRIWFGTFNCQLSYFENDSIYSYAYNDVLNEAIEGKTAMNSFKIDSHGNIWLGFNDQGLIKINNGKLSVANKSIGRTDVSIKFHDAGISYGKIASKEFIKSAQLNLNYYDTVFLQIENHSFASTQLYDKFSAKSGKYRSFVIEKIKNDIFYYTSPINCFLLKKESKNIKIKGAEFIKDVVTSSLYENGNLWLSVRDHGVYKCKIVGDSLKVLDQFLDKKLVSRVFIDREKGIWFLTVGDGVYYLPSENIKINLLKNPNNKITAIEIDSIGGSIYTAYDSGEVLEESSKDGNKFTKMIF